MADAGMAVVQEQFGCSVCLEILKDPVTIPCGHSYCAECIENCWDRGVYSCPQCRETFSPRPALRTNVVLAEVVKKLGKTGLGAASPPTPPPPPPPACCPAGPGDVPCDACPAVKMRAVKSCLVCLVSYCEAHLRLHQEVIPGNRHRLVRADVGRLQEIVCGAHGMPRNVYCRRDRECVCYLCILDGHRGHDTVSTAAERKEKQDQLGMTRGLFQQRIGEKEQELFNLRQAVDSLKSYQSVCACPGAGDLPSFTVNPDASLGAVGTTVHELKRRIADMCKEDLVKISRIVTEAALQSFRIPEPRTRAEFLQYSSQLTLDPKTAHRQLCLSEGNRGVTWSEWTQTCPRLPERFDGCWQVLGREGLSGTRYYWEVEWSGEGAQIGAAYKGIGRKGKGPDCRLGHSDKSWSLTCSGSGCCFWHGNEKTAVTALPTCRIGVYLDHDAGILSFYSVSGEGMTLLHRVQTTFTEPLYLGFGFCGSGAAKGCTPVSSVALCALE
ncbi:tripartite motif-containing protein 16-like protein isoform X2 [Lepisosteus oculatus]|uniref:tripartite motif-containing protein 16-like protein isoform X2 n=1 Tax=Lepisosteus oculatus TaxID=7918 RepID=UPI0037145071